MCQKCPIFPDATAHTGGMTSLRHGLRTPRSAPRLSDVSDTIALRDHLIARLREETSFDHLMVTGCQGRGIGTGNVLVSDWPADFRTVYLNEKLYLADPVVIALRTGHDLVLPDQVEALARDQPRGKTILARKREAGIPLPTALMISQGSARIGSVSVARREALSPSETQALREIGPQLHRAAVRCMAGRAARDHGITPREIDCIAWTAEGKTAWEIGQILSITERTVTAHLTSAMERLGATNRSHAVAIAVRIGLIA